MNPRLRLILFIIGLLTIFIVGIFLAPRAVGFYYQIKGGQLLQSTLRTTEDVRDLGLTCMAIPKEKLAAISKVEDATVKLLKALQFDPRNDQAQLYLGQAYCLLGDPERAMGYYFTYSQSRPNNPLGYMGLGFVYEALDNQVLAAESWKEAGLTPEDFIEAGNESYHAQDYQSALSWYQRAIALDMQQAQAWIKIGQTYDASKDSEQASEAYRKAWEIDPDLATMVYVTSLEIMGKPEAAELVLLQSINTNPNSASRLEWWRKLGGMMQAQKKWDDAVNVTQEAINEFPDEPGLYIDLGWSLYRRGDGLAAAEREFNNAIRINDKIGDGYFALAQLFSQEKEYQEADGYYLRALELSPDNRWYYLARADTARIAGDVPRALEIYREAIRRFPNFAHAYYQLAIAYRHSNQQQDAIDAIEKAIVLLEPPNDSFYARAGEIYRWAGMREEALRSYQQALEINPANSVAQKGIDFLEEE
jgi:tetratricopeptide (TPR) repeat protein